MVDWALLTHLEFIVSSLILVVSFIIENKVDLQSAVVSSNKCSEPILVLQVAPNQAVIIADRYEICQR